MLYSKPVPVCLEVQNLPLEMVLIVFIPAPMIWYVYLEHSWYNFFLFQLIATPLVIHFSILFIDAIKELLYWHLHECPSTKYSGGWVELDFKMFQWKWTSNHNMTHLAYLLRNDVFPATLLTISNLILLIPLTWPCLFTPQVIIPYNKGPLIQQQICTGSFTMDMEQQFKEWGRLL